MSAKYLAVAAMLAIGAPAAALAQGLPPLLQGNYHIVIYNGSGGGAPDSPNSQATTDNPLLDGEPVATLDCVGALNFGLPTDPAPSLGNDTIGGFLESGDGDADCEVVSSVSEFESLTLSSGEGSGDPRFQTSSVYDITFTAPEVRDGVLRHDDGVGLYDGDNLLTPGATGPTTVTNTSFAIEAGSYRLIYVAANGNPSILELHGTPEEPQPDFVNFGCQIDLTQTGVDNAFKTILSATASEKFCPPENSGGLLKLGCSGIIPNYTGGAVVSSESVVCRISGSQCQRPGNWTATVKSISISAGDETTPPGFTRLECEATLPSPG